MQKNHWRDALFWRLYFVSFVLFLCFVVILTPSFILTAPGPSAHLLERRARGLSGLGGRLPCRPGARPDDAGQARLQDKDDAEQEAEEAAARQAGVRQHCRQIKEGVAADRRRWVFKDQPTFPD